MKDRGYRGRMTPLRRREDRRYAVENTRACTMTIDTQNKQTRAIIQTTAGSLL